MKIGIVLHPYDEDKPAGLARTIFEYAKGMLEVDSSNEYIIFLKKKPRTEPALPGENWRTESLGGGRFWLDALRHATPVDVCIFHTPVMPLFYRPKKSIVIALDFAYWYLHEPGIKNTFIRLITFGVNWFALHQADRIVAVSQATVDDVKRLFSVAPKKISLVYMGFKSICVLPQQELAVPAKFFLFVGVVKERKNVFNVVRAFADFSKKHADYFLVVAGNTRGAYGDAIRAYAQGKGISERIKWLEHPNDNELSYIYRRATALVFPTLIEGFGMPVLEAMDCGIPVITSNQSSLKEVGGNGSALLVDPYEPKEIAQAMNRLVDEPELRQKLINAGMRQKTLFSWQKGGRELIAVCNKVYGREL